MSKALFGILVALALAAGLAFRLARLDARPMHHDEANQAIKFGSLLETGHYRYDASDHHGPTLYYLTLPSAWLRGQHTLAALDETTLRLVPAFFGVVLVLLMLPFARGLGRTAVVVAAGLAAVSPSLIYYSRFYIQEMAFACFSLAFLLAAGRYVLAPGLWPAAWTGVAAGMAMATKETWLITLPAAALACGAAGWQGLEQGWSPADLKGPGPTPGTGAAGSIARRAATLRLCAHGALALVAALAIASVFYSSFFTHPAGIIDWFRSFPIYGSRGMGDGRHDEPWFYYLHLLGFFKSGGLLFTEALVLGLSLVGIAFAFRGRIRLERVSTHDPRGVRQQPNGGDPRRIELRPEIFWPRAVSLYALVSALVFSVIRYKTPWNLVPFYAAVVLIAGYGAAQLFARARRPAFQAALAAGLAFGIWHLGHEAWRAGVRYGADPRNPFVYAHTTTDFLRLPARITALASVHPDGPATLVKVLAGPYEQWPMPWYLRRMTRVGYWSQASEATPLDDAPILVASQENAAVADAALGDRYVSEFYGLRPGVLLTLYIERGLWDRFLARSEAGSGR